MSWLLAVYIEGGLISACIILLCAILTKQKAQEGISTALIMSLIWPIAWPLCIYLIIKGNNKK